MDLKGRLLYPLLLLAFTLGSLTDFEECWLHGWYQDSPLDKKVSIIIWYNQEMSVQTGYEGIWGHDARAQRRWRNGRFVNRNTTYVIYRVGD